ncbi:MAG: ATP-dependent acyl-CoA ligase, partial [Ornithinimicrobium sp.]
PTTTQPIGEILVRGRHPGLTMTGYFGMPEATAETVDADGWVRTGDLGALDPDGYLTFHGRVTDSIRRRGENISAYEVEEAVTAHPDVVEAAAIGVPSDLTEEDVKVFVVPRPHALLAAPVLHRYLLEREPRSMVPRYYELVDELPKTPTEKVEKHALRARGRTARTWDSEASRS